MINVQEMIKKAMKKELFPGKDELNLAARQILSEMKTKFVDIKEDITADIQYKMLKKMRKDRENSISIYTEAYEKTNSDVAKSNLEKAQNELEPIDLFLMELESEMPKKLSEDEIKNLVIETLERFMAEGTVPNKGMLMKLFKSRSDVDMAVASKFVNELLK